MRQYAEADGHQQNVADDVCDASGVDADNAGDAADSDVDELLDMFASAGLDVMTVNSEELLDRVEGLRDEIARGEIDLIVTPVNNARDAEEKTAALSLARVAVDAGIPYFTTVEGARAVAYALVCGETSAPVCSL